MSTADVLTFHQHYYADKVQTLSDFVKVTEKTFEKVTGAIGEYSVLHFSLKGPDDVVKQLYTENTTQKETFEDVYRGRELVKNKYWLKERKWPGSTQKTFYSLKKIDIDDNSLLHGEELDNLQAITETLKITTIEDKDEIATLCVTRWTIERNGSFLYLDVSRSKEDAVGNVHNFYICGGARVKSKEKEKILTSFQDFGINNETIIYPTPSKFMEYWYLNDDMLSEKEKDILEEFEQHRGYFYRNANPFDPEMSLSPTFENKKVIEWCSKRLGVSDEITKTILGEMAAQELYAKAPQEIAVETLDEDLLHIAIVVSTSGNLLLF